MVSIVYFSYGRLKGYVFDNVTVNPLLSQEDQMTFYRNMVKQGVMAPDNIVGSGDVFTAVVFGPLGAPLYSFHSEDGDYMTYPTGNHGNYWENRNNG